MFDLIKNNQIFLNKINPQFLVTAKLVSGQNTLIVGLGNVKQVLF